MNIYLEHLGCRLNQAEIQSLADGFARQGNRIATSPTEADWIVLNTCAVTNEASRDSRQRLRALHRLNPNARLLPTGCWTTLHPREAEALPGVWRAVRNEEKDDLLSTLLPRPPIPAGEGEMDLEPIQRTGLSGARLRTRLFVKAQDGCDNRCAFCVTRLARGPGRSRPLTDIVSEINHALASGVREIVLTGVHLGSYGHDLGDRHGLYHLVRAILRDTDVTRLRLSSLEPWDLWPEFFDLWPEADGRLCRHLHLPLQSGCAATLRRMARRTTPEKYAALVAAARERIPQVAISTDVIVGFPGETEREFAETLDFVGRMEFSDLHVFKYSPREGTRAATMRGQVPEQVKRERSRRLRELGEASARAYRSQFVGRSLPVLWEATNSAGPGGWQWQGYTDNYLKVGVTAREMLWNTVRLTRLTTVENDKILGEI